MEGLSIINPMFVICGTLRNLVPFVQFKKREKHQWKSITFITKSNTPPWVIFTFFELYKWCEITQSVSTVL